MLLVYPDKVEVERLWKLVEFEIGNFHTRTNQFEEGNPDLKETADKNRQLHKKVEDAAASLNSALNADDYSKATYIMRSEVDPAIDAIRDVLKDLVDVMIARMKTESEANQAAFNSTILKSIIVFVAGVVFSSLVAFLILSSGVSKPIRSIIGSMDRISSGDTKAEISVSITRRDELGALSKAAHDYKDTVLKIEEQNRAQELAQQAAAEDKRMAMQKIAADFDQRVFGIIKQLGSAAQEMTQTSEKMKNSSDQTSIISNQVSASASHANANVQTVAAAAEELSASSSEIARQIDDVAKKASITNTEAQQTRVSVNELNVLANSIGEVINTIKDIAEQTNLLALNATIEAARAGDAGKGFAVVADEVKKLANETSNKTSEIESRVARIQEAIRNTVIAMEKIIENVDQINSSTTSVAGAVEQQNAATAEIVRNVAEASHGTQNVTTSIEKVQVNASDSGKSANMVLVAANDLKNQADSLEIEVSKFLTEVKSA